MIRLLVMKMLENIKHKKLFLFVISLLVVVGGYFVYKYSYIYLERKKYSQAEVAIKKVAADLEAQGIKTEFSKGCVYQNPESMSGKVGCSVSVNYIGTDNVASAINIFSVYLKATKDLDMSSFDSTSIKSAALDNSSYSREISVQGSNLICSVYYSSHGKNEYWVGLSCGSIPKYKLF